MSEPNNDTTGRELFLATMLVCAMLMFGAAWCGDAIECADKTCPTGQRAALVDSYSNLTGVACACVLQ